MLASQVSRVVTIPGIIIAASRVKAKATAIFAMCTQCSHVKKVPVRAGFAGANLPRVCDRERQPNEAQCPLDSFQIQPEKCEYVDQQTWKLQARHRFHDIGLAATTRSPLPCPSVALSLLIGCVT